MGAPKLLLSWRGRSIIENVLAAWKAGGIERCVVVVHPDDRMLAAVTANRGAEVVVPVAPPSDMKASVQCALRYIENRYAPKDEDVWLLAPADLPTLHSDVIRSLVAAAEEREDRAILVPTHDGRRGHPVLFPWKCAAQVATLGPEEGVNALLCRNAVIEVPFGAAAIPADIDTPEDYERLLG